MSDDPNNIVHGPWDRRPTRRDDASGKPNTDGPYIYETPHGIIAFHEFTDADMAATIKDDDDDQA